MTSLPNPRTPACKRSLGMSAHTPHASRNAADVIRLLEKQGKELEKQSKDLEKQCKELEVQQKELLSKRANRTALNILLEQALTRPDLLLFLHEREAMLDSMTACGLQAKETL